MRKTLLILDLPRLLASCRSNSSCVFKSTLVGASIDIPVTDGRLALGTWQGVYLCEHRDAGGYGGGRARNITVTVQGLTGDG